MLHFSAKVDAPSQFQIFSNNHEMKVIPYFGKERYVILVFEIFKIIKTKITFFININISGYQLTKWKLLLNKKEIYQKLHQGHDLTSNFYYQVIQNCSWSTQNKSVRLNCFNFPLNIFQSVNRACPKSWSVNEHGAESIRWNKNGFSTRFLLQNPLPRWNGVQPRLSEACPAGHAPRHAVPKQRLPSQPFLESGWQIFKHICERRWQVNVSSSSRCSKYRLHTWQSRVHKRTSCVGNHLEHKAAWDPCCGRRGYKWCPPTLRWLSVSCGQ